MLFKDFLLPMPTKGIHHKYKPNKNNIYVYYTIKAYRNAKGQPTSYCRSIGKKDIVTGKLIPNENYFEIFPDKKPKGLVMPTSKSKKQLAQPAKIKQIKTYGDSAAMFGIAEQTGLLKILQKCFPDKWESMLAISFYFLSHSNVMLYIDDWFELTNIPFSESFDDVKCSKLFSSISYEERQNFFAEWSRYRSEKEYMVYDVTSISTYSEKISIAEWGYNRDNEDLRQYNCEMLLGLTTNIPIYYNIYNGSIPDKSHLQFMLKNALNLDIKSLCFVFDCGFVTKDNLAFMLENDYSFITSMPRIRKEFNELVDKAHDNITKIENLHDDYDIYCKQIPVNLDGLDLWAHVCYCPDKNAKETTELRRYLKKLKSELKQMNNSKQITKKYRNYFVIDERSKSDFTYEINHEYVNQKIKNMGFFILLTNDQKINSNTILKNYRQKDIIEKHFHQLKNELEFNRIRTHSEQTTEGKMFVGFLALILRSAMLNLIKNNEETKQLTFDKVLIELKKIRSITFENSKNEILPLTNLQKKILETLKIKIEKK